MKRFNVAIDGPSGAGKSSIADAIAAHYSLIHLDTGAMYRAIAWKLDSMGVSPDASNLEERLADISLEMPEGKVIVDGQDVSSLIRQPEVSNLASLYSALTPVRKRLVLMQQEIAKNKGYILDGRDICDVVLPDAEVKLYLDAAPEARAKRRMLQNQEKGINQSYDEVLESIIKRDERDKNREQAPLRVSKDAVLIDSSDISFDQTVVAAICVIEHAINHSA